MALPPSTHDSHIREEPQLVRREDGRTFYVIGAFILLSDLLLFAFLGGEVRAGNHIVLIVLVSDFFVATAFIIAGYIKTSRARGRS